MDNSKKAEFVRRMGKKKSRLRMAAGGSVQYMDAGGVAGAIGAGAAILGPIGAIGGFIASIFGGGPKMPNIVDPVTGEQITNAQGQVVASQNVLNNYANTLKGQNGAQNQQAVIQALGQVYTGGGPNPAQAMLQEATGQNVANQQALMAGQRGAASNVGLIAREGAQQGANIQQQAVGQNAVLQSGQQLNALNAMGTIAGQQVQETNQANALAANQAATNQQQVLGAQGQYNTNVTGGQGNVNTTQAGILSNAILPSISGASSGLGTAVNYLSQPSSPQQLPGGNYVSTNPSKNAFAGNANANPAPEFKGGEIIKGPHKSHVANYMAMAKGGKVEAMLSPGEIYLTPDHVKEVQHGANPLKMGHRVPGKAKVKGDSLKNDIVPATLEEGGVVLPRHIVNKMSPEKAQLFVLKSLAKRKAKNG